VRWHIKNEHLVGEVKEEHATDEKIAAISDRLGQYLPDLPFVAS